MGSVMRKHSLADDATRFFRKIGNAEDCWEWNGAKNDKGYGQATWNGEVVYAHRQAYRLAYGDFDECLLVCHHCDNPSCVRPNHLFLGTYSDNANDKVTKGRNNDNGNLGSSHGMSKLTEEDVIKIRKEYALGNYSYQDIAGEYEVSWTTIQKIVSRKTWTHV